jgi:beta-fructofuranosidase
VISVPLRVAALYADERTGEQHAAYDWAGDRWTVEPVPLRDVADGVVDLGRFDVCWWHRDRPLDWLADASVPASDSPTDADAPGGDGADAVLRAARAPIRTYLEDGGGLLLTLHGLSAVVPLGIDPVAPDATGHETPPGPHGYLAKAIHEDHPAFETFTDDAIRTRAADADTAFARYESVLPARGDVLAGGVCGGDRLVGQKPLVEWRVGEGRVVGAGAGLSFGDVRDYECGANQERLVGNLLSVLGGPVERLPTLDGRPADAAGFRALRERLADDHHRPGFHLAGPAHWVNDPNGLIQYDGRYHVFYQYNPGGPYHGTIHWGHAVSDDLVHWDDEPVALAPDVDGPDRDGCWSGCAVVDDDGTPTLLYTGGRDRKQLPCLATAAPVDEDGDGEGGTDGDGGTGGVDTGHEDGATRYDLGTWEKDPRNPIIDEAPSGLDILETPDWEAEFRDHCVWTQGDTWYQVIGSGIAGVGGTALLYRADGLDDWSFVGPLLTGDWEGAGAVWECPELVDLGDAQLLHVSDDDRVVYFLGESDLETPGFEVRRRGLLDYGDFYAPQSMRTDDGRLLTWGWLPPARDTDAQWAAGWSGCLSLPRELDVVDGRLRQRPAAELADLRERRVAHGPVTLAAGEGSPVDCTGRACELRLDVEREPGATFDCHLLESPAGSERTTVRWTDDALVVDRSRSSLDHRTEGGEQRVPLDEGADDAGGPAAGPVDPRSVASDGGPDENRDRDRALASGRDLDRLSLRILVDGSVVETFVDEHAAVTSRVYPTRADAEGVTLAARDGEVRVTGLDVWELSSTFPAGSDRREA